MPPVVAKQRSQKFFWAVLFAILFGLGLFVSLPPASSTATELLVDGGFESGSTAFWTPSPGTTIFTLTTSPVHSGAWAASVSSNSNSTKAIIQNINGITAGNRYILSGYAWKNDSRGITFTVRLRLAWYVAADCSGSQLVTADSNNLTANRPEFVFLTTGVITAPGNAQCAQVRAQVAPRAGYSATAYFDDLTLVIASSPPPTVTPTLTVTPTPAPTPAPAEGVIINEVAWGGTAASGSDEWIELYNVATQTINLDGWVITGALDVNLSGVISSGGYFLLERTDDNVVSDIPADLIYTGGLNNNGESLFLGNGFYRVDSVNANGGAWPGGNASPEYNSMERIDPRAPPGDENWASNNHAHRNGLDANGNPLNGTPKQANSTTYPPPTPAPTPAPAEGVIINEVAWGGTAASSSDEWIELYNVATQTINLDGWVITGALDVNLSGVISSGGYFLLERTDDNVVSDIPADLIYTGGLNNNGESLFLGNGFYRVDSVNANGGAWPGGNASPEYNSMERIDPRAPPGDENWTSNNHAHRNGLDANGNPLNGTPKQANSTTYPPPPPPIYFSLNLSELLPDPGGTDWDGDGEANNKDEWIELVNPNPELVSLNDWFLQDAAGTTYTFPEDTVILPGQYLAVYRRTTGIALNNDGDTVSLYRPDDLLSDRIAYSSNPGDDITVCRHPDTGALRNFCLPTPNAVNIVLPPPGPLSLSIYNAKHVTEGAWVKVRGYVTVSPGVFGKNVMYIQDDTHGIRLKLPSGHHLRFDLGTHLEVTGYLDLYYNEWEIDVKSAGDVRRLKGVKLISPLPVDAGMLREGYEGLLVQLTVTPMAFKRSASHFWAEDSTGLAYIYVYRKSGIRRKTVTLGLPATIVGIAGQRTKSRPPLDGYRLYPRAPFDITQYPLPAPPPSNWPTLLPETGGGKAALKLPPKALARKELLPDE